MWQEWKLEVILLCALKENIKHQILVKTVGTI
jgi:hypothetical protein